MTRNLKLYTFKLCPFAHRVRLTLAEKGLSAEMIEINLKNKPADFTSISPYGRVPVLLHGNTRIWESAIIMEYLDEVFPALPLMPKTPSDRATARLWIDFANSRLLAATHRLIFERDEAQRRVLAAQMEGDVRSLEREAMQGRDRRGPYILGDQFTLADIALYPWFEQLATFEKFSTFRMPSDCRGVRDWSAAVAARPAVKACSQTADWYEAGYRQYLAA
jgi:glutathione S-transferase